MDRKYRLLQQRFIFMKWLFVPFLSFFQSPNSQIVCGPGMTNTSYVFSVPLSDYSRNDTAQQRVRLHAPPKYTRNPS